MTETARRLGLTIVILLSSACASTYANSARPAHQPQCASTTFPTNERIGAWSVDKFTGRYTGGAKTLTIRRDQHRLLAEGWILGTRELTAESVESWTWTDGCGVRYAFMLPPDGPGGWLTITTPDGSTTQWRR